MQDRRGAIGNAVDPAVQSDPNPGVAVKAPVLVATTGNITLSGLQTIDGVAVVAGNRVLVKNQTDATTNGIYNPSTGNWTRSVDLQGNSQIASGCWVLVTSGTTQASTAWVVATPDPIMLGTTAINFSQQQISTAAFNALMSSVASATAATNITATPSGLPNSRTLSSTAPITLTDSGGGAALTVALTTPLAQAYGGTGLTSFSNLANARLAKTAAYAVQNGDKGKTIALGGSAYYTLTVNAASGYDADFQVRVLNEDTGRGKLLAVNGITSYILWPGQSVVIYAQNDVWHLDKPFEAWAAGPTFYVDNVFGSDSNDGLASASGAFATIQNAFNVLKEFVFCNGTPTIQLTSGQIYTENVEIYERLNGIVHIFEINGNTSSPSNYKIRPASGIIIDCQDWAAVTVQGVDLGFYASGVPTSNGVACINSRQYSVVDTNNCRFTNANNAFHLSTLDHGSINASFYEIDGNAARHISGSDGDHITIGGTIVVDASLVFTTFAVLTDGSTLINSGAVSFSSLGSVTGATYAVTTNAVLDSSGGISWPTGLSGTSTATGGQAV